MGSFLYLLHQAFQSLAEPIRYWKAKRDLKRFIAPLDKQEAEARRKHQAVEPFQAAKRALIIHALSHRQAGA